MPDDETTVTEAGNSSGTGEQAQAGANSSDKFTQADLDRVAGKVRKEAVNQFIRDLGLETADDLKAILAAKKEADERAKSDLDKAQEKAQRAEADAEAARQRLWDILIRAEFRVQTFEQVADVDLAYLVAMDAGLLGDLKVDIGTGKVEGVKEVVEKLLKDKPILKKTAPAQAAGTGGAQSGDGRGAGAAASRERLKARFGI